MDDFEARQDVDGLNRVYYKKDTGHLLLAPRAMRKNNGNLILDERKARKNLAAIAEPDEIVEQANLIEFCGNNDGYRAAKKFHAAIALLPKAGAKKLLDSAVKECESLKEVSIYHYLLAYIAQENGNQKERDRQLKLFLARAESSYPVEFFQTEMHEFFGKGVLENAAYRSAAEEALATNKPISFQADYPGARMRYNSVYNPGGQNTYRPIFMFLLGGNRFESMYGLIYDRPFKYFSLLPTVTIGTESGTYLGLKARKQFYESYDRHFMYGGTIGLQEWKSITYTGRALGDQIYDTRATVEEDGYHYYISNGFTYRPWLPSFGLAAQVQYTRLTNVNRNKIYSTALLFWEFMRDMGLRAGLLNNDLIAEYYVWNMFVGYNFDTEYLNVGIGRTF